MFAALKYLKSSSIFCEILCASPEQISVIVVQTSHNLLFDHVPRLLFLNVCHVGFECLSSNVFVELVDHVVFRPWCSVSLKLKQVGPVLRGLSRPDPVYLGMPESAGGAIMTLVTVGIHFCGLHAVKVSWWGPCWWCVADESAVRSLYWRYDELEKWPGSHSILSF